MGLSQKQSAPRTAVLTKTIEEETDTIKDAVPALPKSILLAIEEDVANQVELTLPPRRLEKPERIPLMELLRRAA